MFTLVYKFQFVLIFIWIFKEYDIQDSGRMVDMGVKWYPLHSSQGGPSHVTMWRYSSLVFPGRVVFFAACAYCSQGK